MTKKYKILLALVLVLLISAAGFLPAYRAFKTWRAEQLAGRALELAEEPSTLAEAWQRANSAYFLAPGNLEVVRAMAEVMSRADAAQAVKYWDFAIELSEGARSDRLGKAEAALDSGQPELARAELEALGAADSGEDGEIRLYARLLAAERRYREGMAYLEERVRAADAPEAIHALYLGMSQRATEADLRRKGLEHVRRLAARDDDLGYRALSLLVPLAPREADLREYLKRRIGDHPLSDRALKLSWISARLDMESEDREALREEAEALFDRESTADLAELGRWLNRNGFPGRVEAYLPLSRAVERQDLFLIFLDSLALQGAWERVRRILEDRQVPLENYLRQVFLARSYLETGLERRASLGWQRVRLEVANDPAKLGYFAEYARRLGLYEEAREAYRRMAELPVAMGRGFEERLEMERRLKNTAGLLETLESMEAAYPKNESVRNDAIYIRLLRGEDVARGRAEAAALVEARPDFFAHRITLALAHFREGAYRDALDVFEGVTIPVDQLSASWRVVLGAILRANGQDDQADRVFRGIDARALLPEEVELLEAYGPGR